MKKIQEEGRDILDVDCAYDWTNYMPDQNLNKFKEKWNRERVKVAKNLVVNTSVY